MHRLYLKYIKPIFGNKYLLVLVLFGIWMVFFDDNNLLTKFKYDQKISKLKQEIAYYQKEKEQSNKKIQELQSSSENLEKFAREQYLMKKSDEDIFIFK